MDDFVSIPYHEYTRLLMMPFLQKNLGLLALTTNQQATQTILPKPIKHQSTQTEPPREEQSTQTRRQGMLWGYFD